MATRKFKNIKERRDFLKEAGTGALGFGAVLSGLAASDPVFARMSAINDKKHVDILMEETESATISSEADSTFIQSLGNLRKLIKADSNAKQKLSEMTKFISNIDIDKFGNDTDGILLPLKNTPFFHQ